jgi:alginate O-acetyltransferase complex protein AlgJ
MGSLKSTAKSRNSPRRARHLVLIAAFLTILYLPVVGMIIRPYKPPLHAGWQESENQPFPTLTWQVSSILSFPKGLGQYFQYHFGFRRDFIRWHTKLAGEALGKSSSQRVVEGKDGWLFLGESGTIEDYRGLLPFTTRQLRQWQAALENRRDGLAGQGIHYIFVICPDKHTVYPEYMPDRINRVHTQTRLDQLVRHMKGHSDLEILDLRPALATMKGTRLCYQPQETHWNGIGAFAGYQQIAQRLRVWYPDLRIIDMNDCEVFKEENTQTDLLRLQGKDNCTTFAEGVRPIDGFMSQLRQDPNDRGGRAYKLMRSTNNRARIGKLLMFHDSFAPSLMPFLAEHFREGLYIWSKDDGLLPQEVLDFKPDVVIEQVVERRLCNLELDLLKMPFPASE